MANEVIFDENTTSHKTWKGVSKLIAIVLILAVAALGDVMYIKLVGDRFPSGPLLLFCYVGAFASFGAFAYLLVGKLVVFRPGPQMAAAWCLFAMEIAIAALNVMLVFQGAANVTGFMAMWLMFSPATPFIVMAMVALVFFLDPELQEKHKDMDLQAQINQMERNFKKMQFIAELEVRKETLKLTQSMLMEHVHATPNVQQLRTATAHMYADMMGRLTGRAIPALPAHNVVDSTATQQGAVSLAQEATVDVPPTSEKGGGKQSKK